LQNGSILLFTSCGSVHIQDSTLDVGTFHSSAVKTEAANTEASTDAEASAVCEWDGSAVLFMDNSTGWLSHVEVRGFAKGGLGLHGGSLSIVKGEFADNGPGFHRYPSARRNIVCGDSGILSLESLMGGDGVTVNTSLWILNVGSSCVLSGLPVEYASEMFIPTITNVEIVVSDSKLTVNVMGSLLLPCAGMMFELERVAASGTVRSSESGTFVDFVNESVVVGSVGLSQLENGKEKDTWRVRVLFPGHDSFNYTTWFVVNRLSDDADPSGKNQQSESGIATWFLILLGVVNGAVIVVGVIIAVYLMLKGKKQQSPEATGFKPLETRTVSVSTSTRMY
jgi:hypothetical protein